jgi:D-xylose transport system substrate-binding protein
MKSTTKALILALGVTTSAVSAQAADAKKVFFLLPNSTTIRFEARDAPMFKAAMEKYAPGTEVVIQNGEGDPTRQQRLAEDAISQNAAVIVLAASDSNLAAGTLSVAEKAGVPVVLYDHDAIGGKADAHVVFDSLAVGKAQGERAAALINALSKTPVKIARVKGNQGEYGTKQYEAGQDEYLKPLIDSGKVQVVCEQYIQNWDPVQAQSFSEDCLTKNGGDVDVFVTMNDGMAGGIVAALIGQGFKPGEKAIAGGQNADVEALRYIAQGWLDDTVMKDLRVQADHAAQVTASLLNGKGVPMELVNGVVNNQFMDVPAVFMPVQNIMLGNLGDVVKAGVWTWADICKGIETTDVCKQNM